MSEEETTPTPEPTPESTPEPTPKVVKKKTTKKKTTKKKTTKKKPVVQSTKIVKIKKPVEEPKKLTDEEAQKLIHEAAVAAEKAEADKARVEEPAPTPEPEPELPPVSEPSDGYFQSFEKPNDSFFAKQMREGVTTTLEVVEYFHLLSRLQTRNEQIRLLRCAKTDPVIMLLLNINFEPQNYKPFTPVANPKQYRRNNLPWGINKYTLRKEYRRLKYLLGNSAEGKKLPPHVKSNVYFEFMESLHPSEARILQECFTQSLELPGFNGNFAELVKEAFGKSRFPSIS